MMKEVTYEKNSDNGLLFSKEIAQDFLEIDGNGTLKGKRYRRESV